MGQTLRDRGGGGGAIAGGRNSLTHLELVHLLPLPVGVHLEVLPLGLEAVGAHLGLLQLVLKVVQLVQQLLLVGLDLQKKRRRKEGDEKRSAPSARFLPLLFSPSFVKTDANSQGMLGGKRTHECRR